MRLDMTASVRRRLPRRGLHGPSSVRALCTLARAGRIDFVSAEHQLVGPRVHRRTGRSAHRRIACQTARRRASLGFAQFRSR